MATLAGTERRLDRACRKCFLMAIATCLIDLTEGTLIRHLVLLFAKKFIGERGLRGETGADAGRERAQQEGVGGE